MFSYLRLLRICVGALVLCAIGAKFLDVYHDLPEGVYLWALKAQFAPSLIRLVSGEGLVLGLAFIVFCALTLLFGRVYCSFFCPLGIFMDFVRRIAKFPTRNKLLKKTCLGQFCVRNFTTLRYSRGKTALRVTFTTLAALCIIFGYTALLGLIEPYSLFGKIMGCIGSLFAAFGITSLSETLASFDVYSVPPIDGSAYISVWAFAFALFVLLALCAASAMRGRVHCNTLCPVGGLLGLFSKFSVFKISFDKSACIGCGICAKQCKSQCMDFKSRRVDFDRCVMCFDCGKVCPKKAIDIGPNGFLKKLFAPKRAPATSAEEKSDLSVSRRRFVPLAASLGALLCTAAKSGGAGQEKHGRKEGETHAENYAADKTLTSPPGSKSIENFLTKCTACQLCVSACKTRILKPSLTEWGLSGFMQPYMDYMAGFCLHECAECAKVCPTGAIKLISEKEKLTEKIGTAVFRKKLCVVHKDGTDCAACAEHCPVSAIEMIPFRPEKSLYIPHVHDDVCIGCGACENICPVLPERAIVVRAEAVHSQAKVFQQSMRLYVPQKTEEKKPGSAPPANPFPF